MMFSGVSWDGPGGIVRLAGRPLFLGFLVFSLVLVMSTHVLRQFFKPLPVWMGLLHSADRLPVFLCETP